MTDSLTITANTSSSIIYVPASVSTLWLYLTVSLWPDISNSTKCYEVGSESIDSNSTNCDKVGSNIDMSQVVMLKVINKYAC